MTTPEYAVERFDGKRVLITGAASGIGLACAQRFAGLGAELIVLDRSEAATKVADDLGGTALVADLSDVEALAALDLDADIVINNAGFQHVAPIGEFPVDVFGTMLTVMLHAPFTIAHVVMPKMIERGWGRFIHLSSAHGQRASAFKSAYVSAKHGLEGLSKVIAIEGAPYGVTSNTICPGYVRTPLVEAQIADQARAHKISEKDVVNDVMLARTPVKRLIEPDEVARLAAFLCGPGSESFTGSAYEMTGGWTAT